MSFKFSDCDFAHPRAESFFLLDLDQDRPPALLFGERALGIVGCVVKRGSQSVTASRNLLRVLREQTV